MSKKAKKGIIIFSIIIIGICIATIVGITHQHYLFCNGEFNTTDTEFVNEYSKAIKETNEYFDTEFEIYLRPRETTYRIYDSHSEMLGSLTFYDLTRAPLEIKVLPISNINKVELDLKTEPLVLQYDDETSVVLKTALLKCLFPKMTTEECLGLLKIDEVDESTYFCDDNGKAVIQTNDTTGKIYQGTVEYDDGTTGISLSIVDSHYMSTYH